MSSTTRKIRVAGLALAALTTLGIAPTAAASTEDQQLERIHFYFNGNASGQPAMTYSPAGGTCRPTNAEYNSAWNESSQGQWVYSSHNCQGVKKYVEPRSKEFNFRIKSFIHS